MSSLVEFSMPFDYTLATTYFIAGAGMTLNDSVYGVNATFGTKTSGSQAWATLNDTAKGKLFPNSTAHPVSMSYAFSSSRPVVVGASAHALYLQIDGEPIANTYGTNTSLVWARGTDVVNAAITGATKSSTIRFGLETSNFLYRALGCSESGSGYFLSFNFTRYDFSASAGANIAFTFVSSSTGYDGDQITYSCVLASGAEFDGWYNGSTRVSTSQSYTLTVAGADKALQARATMPVVTKTLSATYNGARLEGFPISVTADVPISYNGASKGVVPFSGGSKTFQCAGKIASGTIGIGGKTLSCAGKLMTTDVVASITGDTPQPVAEYTMLSHISTNNGAAYIDTGVNPNNPIITMQYFGTVEAGTESTAWIAGAYDTDHYFAIGQLDNRYVTAYMTNNDATTVTVQDHGKIRVDTVHTTLNGTTIKTTSGAYTKGGSSFLIFAASRNGAPYNPQRMASMSVEYCEIWDGSTLLRAYRPAIRNSDHAVGMLDVAHYVFYGSATSTPFVAGTPIG